MKRRFAGLLGLMAVAGLAVGIFVGVSPFDGQTAEAAKPRASITSVTAVRVSDTVVNLSSGGVAVVPRGWTLRMVWRALDNTGAVLATHERGFGGSFTWDDAALVTAIQVRVDLVRINKGGKIVGQTLDSRPAGIVGP